MSAFDQYYDDMITGKDKDKIKPFYSIDYKKEEEVHKWLKSAFHTLMAENEDRIKNVSENHKLYKGDTSNSSLSRLRGEGYQTHNISLRDQELFVNYMKHLADEQINKITEVKPDVDVTPVHNEHDDKVASKIAKSIIDTRFYEDNFDKILRRVTRRAKIAGDDFLHIFWNKDKGPKHPSVLKESKEMYLVTDSGEFELDDDGKKIPIDKDLRIGEIDFELVDTRHLLPEPCDSFNESNWVIRLKREYVYDLKKDHPKKSGKVKPINSDSASINGMTKQHIADMELKEQTLCLYFFHKPHKNLKKGFYIKATLDCILEMGAYPYEMDCLPFIQRQDKIIEGELHGQSFMHDIKALQAQHTDLTSMIMQNIKLCAHPKWFVEQGSVAIQSLGSGRTVVQTRPGTKRPELSIPPTVPNDVFSFRENLKSEMRVLGTGAINEPGAPPPGVTAGVALQFLNEQENKRYNTDIAGHFDFIRASAEMILRIAHQFYDEDDGRYLRLLGKNNEHTAVSFKKIDVNRPYDIRITHTTGLPSTKSAKIQTIIDLGDKFEGLFTKEQLIDLIELGDSNKMYDQATAAVKSAESILEDLLQGNQVMEPQKYENLIVFWKVFVAEIQKRSFKETVPEHIRQAVLDYIGAMEMMMVEKANQNQTFAAEMATLSLFPVMFEMPPVEPVVDPAMMNGMEGAPGTQPLLDPAASDGSEAAIPQETETMSKRSDADY